MTEHVDVVVIGGGQAGLACSYWLSRAGVEHLVVDEQEEPGGALSLIHISEPTRRS